MKKKCLMVYLSLISVFILASCIGDPNSSNNDSQIVSDGQTLPNGTYIGSFQPGVHTQTSNETFTATFVKTTQYGAQYIFTESNVALPIFSGYFGNYSQNTCMASMPNSFNDTNWAVQNAVENIYFSNCRVVKDGNITTVTALYYYTDVNGQAYPYTGGSYGTVTMTSL